MRYSGRGVLLLALLAGLSAGCGPTPTPEVVEVEREVVVTKEVKVEVEREVVVTREVEVEKIVEIHQPAEKTKISYWYSAVEGAQPDCVLPITVDAFNAQSESVVVEVELNPELWEASRTALAAGSGPDIVVTPGTSFVFELAAAGQLLPLNTFVKQMGWEQNIVPWALDLGVVDGNLYSLPVELETLVLYYNKTLFDEKGWKPPKTIDELWALAQTMQDEGVIPFTAANSEWRPMNEWFVGEFLNHVAGPQKVYDALNGKTKWTDPAFVEAVTLLNEAQQKGWFMGGLDRYYTGTESEFTTALATGEGGMNIEGTWFLARAGDYFADSGMEWDWVPVPSKSGDAIFDIGMGSTYSINAASKNPQAAAEFLSFLFTPEIQGQLLSQCGIAPAPVKFEADKLEGIDPRVAGIFAAMADASDKGDYGYTTWTFFPPKSDVYIYEDVERVWAGHITPEEYLSGLQDLFDEEFSAGAIPPIPAR